MKDEQEEGAGLLARWKEEADRKREEFWRALEEGGIGEPFSATVFGSVILAKILGGVAISAAASVGTSLLTRALTPRQKTTSGQLTGTLRLPEPRE
jgi:hypothetical protein